MWREWYSLDGLLATTLQELSIMRAFLFTIDIAAWATTPGLLRRETALYDACSLNVYEWVHVVCSAHIFCPLSFLNGDHWNNILFVLCRLTLSSRCSLLRHSMLPVTSRRESAWPFNTLCVKRRFWCDNRAGLCDEGTTPNRLIAVDTQVFVATRASQARELRQPQGIVTTRASRQGDLYRNYYAEIYLFDVYQ